MFNKLLEEKQLKYIFTDKRKLYYSNQIGNGLGEILNLYYYMLLNLEKIFSLLLLLQE